MLRDFNPNQNALNPTLVHGAPNVQIPQRGQGQVTQVRVPFGISSAKQIPRPDFAKLPRRSGARAQGLKFERDVAKLLPEAQWGLWFRYSDSHGSWYCSPDAVLDLGPFGLAILECKLTDTSRARQQLTLYCKVLRLAWGLPTRGLVVAKNLAPWSELSGVCETLPEALRRASASVFPLWHLPRPGIAPGHTVMELCTLL